MMKVQSCVHLEKSLQCRTESLQDARERQLGVEFLETERFELQQGLTLCSPPRPLLFLL
jgi:hypothetical protein